MSDLGIRDLENYAGDLENALREIMEYAPECWDSTDLEQAVPFVRSLVEGYRDASGHRQGCSCPI
jgi:hypothetical protein